MTGLKRVSEKNVGQKKPSKRSLSTTRSAMIKNGSNTVQNDKKQPKMDQKQGFPPAADLTPWQMAA